MNTSQVWRFPKKYAELFRNLSDEEVGRIIKSLFLGGGNLEGLSKAYFDIIKVDLDNLEKTAMNGLKGGRPKKEETSGYEKEKPQVIENDNLKEKINEKERVNERIKEKERVNTKPTIVVFEEKSELELLLIEFKRSRAKSRRPMTEKAMELLLKKLSAYSKQEQIAMLEEAIEKGWQSVYPPKQENRAGKNLKVMEAIANHNFT